jgi:hypothetical protein
MAMKKKLGEILVASGAITPQDVEAALSDQRLGEPARLGDLLVSMGRLTTRQLAKALAQQHEVPFTELPPIPSSILELVPMDFQRQFRFVPLKVTKGSISIAMADLSHASTDVLPVLRRRFPSIQIFVAPGDAIDAVHTAVSGKHEGPRSGVAAAVRQIGDVESHGVTELFESLDLDFSDDTPDDGTGRFSSLEAEAPSPTPPVQAPIPLRFEAFGPGKAPGLAQTAASPASPPPESRARPRPASPALVPRSSDSRPPSPRSDDLPFFGAAARNGRSVGRIDDQAFIPGVPASSPSSLAELVIEPELPPLPIVPPADLKVTVVSPRSPVATDLSRPAVDFAVPPPAQSHRPPVAPARMEEEIAAPSPSGGWTGALDVLPPSRLIVAVVKALIRRGLLSEQEVISAAESGKK